MPDDNRTHGPSNDAPRDPLDELIAPILGRDITPEPRNVPTLLETSKHSRHNPLDDLVTDTELRAESGKATARFVSKDHARRDFLRTTPASKFLILALVVVAIGALIGEQFGGRRAWKEWSEQFFSEGKRQVDTGAELPSTAERSMALVPTQILTPKELFASASRAIVRVNVYNARSKPIGHGSGFFVRDDSTVVTNFHVIDGANSAEVVLKDGTQLPVRGVEAADEASDIAILKVDHGTKSVVRYLTLGSNELPPVGGRVYVIGSPKGYDYTLSDGIVSGHHERDGRQWIQTTAPISHGSSGSPVLSEDGSVLGIATWVDWGGQNLNFASPTRAIASLLGGDSKFRSLLDLIGEKTRLLISMRETLENGDKDDAARLLDGLPKSFHELSEFWVLKGNVYYRQLEFGAALLAYSNAIAIRDQDSKVWWQIGSSHFLLSTLHRRELGDDAAKQHLEEAVRAYRKGTDINPNDDKCWNGLGSSLLKTSHPLEAVVALRRCLAVNPNDDGAHESFGDALAEQGDVEGAIAEYKTSLDLKLKKTDWLTQYSVGFSYYQFGNFLEKHTKHKDAIAAFEKALTLMPNDMRGDLRERCEEALTKSRLIESFKKSK